VPTQSIKKQDSLFLFYNQWVDSLLSLKSVCFVPPLYPQVLDAKMSGSNQANLAKILILPLISDWFRKYEATPPSIQQLF
jgi:hypothetical protein